MKTTLIVIASTPNQNVPLGEPVVPITIQKVEFDSENQEDRDSLEEYLEQDETLDNNWQDAALHYVHENEVAEYNQRFVVASVYTEEEFRIIQSFKF